MAEMICCLRKEDGRRWSMQRSRTVKSRSAWVAKTSFRCRFAAFSSKKLTLTLWLRLLFGAVTGKGQGNSGNWEDGHIFRLGGCLAANAVSPALLIGTAAGGRRGSSRILRFGRPDCHARLLDQDRRLGRA